MSINLVTNTLIEHKLGTLRSNATPPDTFRRIIGELSVQLFYAAASNLPTCTTDIETPFSNTQAQLLKKHVSLMPIMRAGNGMLEAILKVWPEGSVGHIGIYRDKFLNNTVEYYFKAPENIAQSSIMLMDPIIATGDTAKASVDRLKELGCTDISFLSLICSQAGADRLMESHPDISLFTITTEDTVTDENYVTPGIGDVGARYYNTK